MKKYSKEFPIEKMAKVLKVSRYGYYKYINKKESATVKENKKLAEEIISIYNENRGVYGSPRIHKVLKKQGKKFSRNRVAKIMKQNNIVAKTKKKWKCKTTTTTKDISKIAPNLINQNFVVNKKDTTWVSDITYIETCKGWLYLSTILDLYSRKVVGFSMGNEINTNLIKRSLDQAILHRMPERGLILHSDRGCQYTSSEYKKHTFKYGIVLSMSSTGNCYDNAAMESFFHTLKTEHVYFNNFKTRQDAILSIFEYIEIFYNRKRLHSTLNYCSPCEFEQIMGLESTNQPESRVNIALPAKEEKLLIHNV
jgi:putative transposase